LLTFDRSLLCLRPGINEIFAGPLQFTTAVSRKSKVTQETSILFGCLPVNNMGEKFVRETSIIPKSRFHFRIFNGTISRCYRRERAVS